MSKTFCVQPWLGKDLPSPFLDKSQYDNSSFRYCCWMTYDYDIEKVRQDLLDGVPNSACSKCWQAEQRGESSQRQIRNTLADNLYDLNIDNLKAMVSKQGYTPTIYQVPTSNLCNGACIMCSGALSTKWQSIDKENKEYKYEILEDIQIEYDTAKFVEFVGGEPLLEQRNIEILEQLNPDCVISLVTNGSVEINKKLLQVLAKFKRVIICLSIDGIEQVFEYQRWPLQWNKLLENLTKFRDLQCDISVSYTSTNVNLPYKQQTIDWITQQGLPYIVNDARYPSYFNPSTPIGVETISELDRQDKLKGIDRRDYGFNF